MQTSGPNEKAHERLEVDLLLEGYRLFGVSHAVDERTRFGDVLNSRDEVVQLQDACVYSIKGRMLESVSEITVEKRLIIAAVPRETAEFVARHKMYRAGMLRPTRDQVRVLVMIPPYAARGAVHVPPGTDVSRISRAVSARFFPMTDASLFLGDEGIFEGPVVLLNGDVVASVGRIRAVRSSVVDPMEYPEMPLPG